ncbi:MULTISPECIES: hypothetical protein [unclassified Adlercreutzia]|uniref:hypothetical protein n=1 Tax=unclassified Adlercreutzia TaxID=2636013 RepID=UPI0013EA27DC|nr:MULTISPECIES: hypothetical protein [unclassified Adlercreutzia]
MNSTSHSIQSILRRAVDGSAIVDCANDEVPLSPFLSGSFNLYRGNALGSSVLFAESTSDAEEPLKRLDALERAVGEPVTIFLPSATASQKRSLMTMRRGFLTERGDMYLPQLAVALKAAATRKPAVRAFTPAQQQAFLYCLLESEPLSQEGLRELVGISAAGASRALSSLSEAGLIDYEVGGKTKRKREYFVPDRAELFRKGKKLFGDPVKSIETGIRAMEDHALASGLSALALRSELVPPSNMVVATGPNVKPDESLDVGYLEESCVVQRLSYDPTPFAERGMVDPFTMFMTIGEKDERISIALREALRGYPWYRD